MDDKNNLAEVNYSKGEVMTTPTDDGGIFGITPEMLEKQLTINLEKEKMVKRVISKLLVKNTDYYYMSQLKNGGKYPPKEGEAPKLKKAGVDRTLGFFSLRCRAQNIKIDGGYEVRVIGTDRNGNYIDDGVGVCTVYEKKYVWIKAEEEEYTSAPENDRRIVTRKNLYKGGTYQVKQIRTDERSISHTLISMATKRAREAFAKKALPALNDFAENSDDSAVYEPAEKASSQQDRKARPKEIKDMQTRAIELGFTEEQITAITKEETGGRTSKNLLLSDVKHLNDYFFDTASDPAGTADEE